MATYHVLANHKPSPTSPKKGQKRPFESNEPVKPAKIPKTEQKSPSKKPTLPEPEIAWNFDDVQTLLEKIEFPTRSESWTSTIRKIDFNQLQFGPYNSESCQKLFQDLVHSTRRYRTLQEIVIEIKENLSKKTYTNVISKSSIKELPKKPPSAYILFHAEKMLKKRKENPNLRIKDVSAEISRNWKLLPEKERDKYRQKEKELKDKYEQECVRLGLGTAAPPKRPFSARTMYIENKIGDKDLTEEELAKQKAKYGQKFDEMSPEDREKYLIKHKKIVEEYRQKMEEYRKATPYLNHIKPNDKKSKNRTAKPPEAPKSALKFFMDKKLSKVDPDEIETSRVKYKEKFNNLTESKLIKYIKKAVADKQRYDDELKVFMEENPDYKLKPVKVNINEKQRSIYERVVKKRPPPPAGSAYIQFCGEKLAQMNSNDEDFHPTKQMQTVSAEWKEFSEEDLRKANESVIKGIETYIPAMEAWLTEQPMEVQLRIQKEEPRAMPDFWRKVLQRRKKALNKK